MVLPSAIGNSIVEFWNLSDATRDFIATISALELGTSIPTVPFQGIGAIILIPRAAKLRAISSSRFFILEIRTPGAGIISYKVTVGPIVAFILDMFIL